MRVLAILPILMLLAPPAMAAEKAQLMLPGAAIKGIEATPRVTFIVPWQRSHMKEFALLPTHSALDALYLPLSSQQLELDVELGGRRPRAQQ